MVGGWLVSGWWIVGGWLKENDSRRFHTYASLHYAFS